MGSGPEVVVALGGGAARGLAHIGILKVLEEAGVRIRAVAGTSIGSLVGGAYAAGKLAEYEEYARGIDAAQLLRLLDVSVSGAGLLRGARVVGALRDVVGEPDIEDLPLPFAAVATVLQTGEERRIRSGPLLHAMRASMAIPGVFKPVQAGEDWLVDGGVSAPVPVQAARELAPELPCIAVNLNNSDMVYAGEILDAMDHNEDERKLSKLERMFQKMRSHGDGKAPGLLATVSDSVTHLEHRLTRYQLAAYEPELVLEPAVYGLGLFDFHRAGKIIEAGERCMREMVQAGGLEKLDG